MTCSDKLKEVTRLVIGFRDAIGDGTHDDDISNILLENAPTHLHYGTMAGQAYEDLAIAYHCLHRAQDILTDLIGEQEYLEEMEQKISFNVNDYKRVTRIVFKEPIPQEGEELERMNAYLKERYGTTAVIDWRDPWEVDIR